MSTHTTWHTAFDSYHTGEHWKVPPREVENLLFDLSGEVFPRVQKSLRQFKTFYQGQKWKVSPKEVEQFIDEFIKEVTY